MSNNPKKSTNGRSPALSASGTKEHDQKDQQRKAYGRAELKRFIPYCLMAEKLWRQRCEDWIAKNGLPPQCDVSAGIFVLKKYRGRIEPYIVVHAQLCCPGNYYVWRATSGPIIDYLVAHRLKDCWYQDGLVDMTHDGVNFGDPTKVGSTPAAGSKPSDNGSKDRHDPADHNEPTEASSPSSLVAPQAELVGSKPADAVPTPVEKTIQPTDSTAAPTLTPDPVDGEQLLAGIREVLNRYLILPLHAAVAITLWIVHTYLYRLVRITPYLIITSPQKRCGKSTLMEILRLLSSSPEPMQNVTIAAVFRLIEKCSPTLLIDEADTFLAANGEIRGILNSGNRHDGYVLRVVPGEQEPYRFPTYCPKAIAQIRAIHETLADRGIEIKLQRKKQSETVKKLRDADSEQLRSELAPKIVRWAEDHTSELTKVTPPSVPEELDSRAQDCWEPLLAIAQVVGGEWPKRAEAAAIALSADRGTDDSGTGVGLLADLRDVFAAQKQDKLPTDVILTALKNLEERPWAGWASMGKGLSPHGLAKLLKPFGVKSRTIRRPVHLGSDTFKGYCLEDLKDAFERYLDQVRRVEEPEKNP